jgi:hypothetical protein
MKKSWSRSEFTNYLINGRKLSAKVAGDIASRCVRVEKTFELDLKEATKNEAKLKSLHLNIAKFGVQTAETSTKAYSLSSNLRLAINYFSEYIWGTRIDPYSIYYRYTKVKKIKKIN